MNEKILYIISLVFFWCPLSWLSNSYGSYIHRWPSKENEKHSAWPGKTKRRTEGFVRVAARSPLFGSRARWCLLGKEQSRGPWEGEEGREGGSSAGCLVLGSVLRGLVSSPSRSVVLTCGITAPFLSSALLSPLLFFFASPTCLSFLLFLSPPVCSDFSLPSLPLSSLFRLPALLFPFPSLSFSIATCLFQKLTRVYTNSSIYGEHLYFFTFS